MQHRLLVLGATGFLGAHVLDAIAPDAARAWAACRRPASPHLEERPNRAARPPSEPEPRWLALDVTDAEALSRALDESAPTAVLSLAALARQAACETDPERARAVNAEAPRELARHCAARGVRLVHVSTDLVFGGRPAAGAGGFVETDPPSPVSVYGRSKAEGERGVLAEFPDALVVRLPLLYGPAHGRPLGASESLLAAVRSGQRPPLLADEWRTPLEVRDAAAALVELALRPDRPAGLLHVAGPVRLSRHELGLLALEAVGHAPAAARALVRAAQRSAVAAGAPRPSDVALDATRARAVLATELRDPRAALGISALP